MPKAYPVYDDTYRENVEVMRRWFEEHAPNVHPVGRNGMHKYNNQDHSMYTAMLTVENIHGAHHDIWSVNVEEEYHETAERSGRRRLRRRGPPAGTRRSCPAVPAEQGPAGPMDETAGRRRGIPTPGPPTAAHRREDDPGLDLILDEVEAVVDPIAESAAFGPAMGIAVAGGPMVTLPPDEPVPGLGRVGQHAEGRPRPGRPGGHRRHGGQRRRRAGGDRRRPAGVVPVLRRDRPAARPLLHPVDARLGRAGRAWSAG